MNYFMAFVIGVLVNLGWFKLQLARLESRNAEYIRKGMRILVKDYTINWKRVGLDALFWGLAFLVVFFLYVRFHH